MEFAKSPLRSALLSLALFSPIFAIAAPDQDQNSQQPPSEAEVRWQALSGIANLYLGEAPADAFMEKGDEEKSQWNNYAGALAYYLIAADKNETEGWASYQAAAALTFLQLPEEADKYLQQADKRGFWRYITMEEDDELAPRKGHPAYDNLLAHSKQRYQQHATDVGKAYVYVPQGKAPKGGWPVIVWLSGYGTEGSDSASMAKIIGADKAVFIGINGTQKLSEHHFRWSRTDISSTQQAVKNALALAEKKTPLDHQRIALMGFSQGALHGAKMLAQYSDDYCGALIVSAGGRQTALDTKAPEGKRIVFSYGEDEYSSNKALDTKLIGYFDGNNQLQQYTHKGGHFFDHEWKQKFPQYVDFVLGLTAK